MRQTIGLSLKLTMRALTPTYTLHPLRACPNSLLVHYSHLIRAYGGIPLTTIEITAAQMVMCMNLTSFAWSVYDGRRQEDKLDAQQKEHRVPADEFPSLLEFLGYA